MVLKDILLKEDQDILKRIGIQDKERFIEKKILKRQKNAGVMLAIKLDIMQMNFLINSIKKKD